MHGCMLISDTDLICIHFNILTFDNVLVYICIKWHNEIYLARFKNYCFCIIKMSKNGFIFSVAAVKDECVLVSLS